MAFDRNLRVATTVAATTFALGLGARTAAAQEAVVTEVLSANVTDPSGLYQFEGNGYELSHGLILHGAGGLSGGASNNVFAESSKEAPTGSGLLRLNGSLYLSNDRPSNRDLDLDPDQANDLTPLDYTFRAGLRASYQEFLSGAQKVRNQRSLSVGAAVDAMTKPEGPFSLILSERFRRDMRSPDFQDNSNLNRDDNHLYVGARYQTDDQLTRVQLHYDNDLHVFEDQQPYVGRMNHTVGLGTEHQIGNNGTIVFSNVSVGFFGPFGENTNTVLTYKTHSNPVRILAGLAAELTPQVNLRVHAGFAHASYGARPDGRSDGYDALIAHAQIGAKVGEQGHLLALYDFDHFDAAQANFFRDHLLALRYVHQLGFLFLDGGPEVRFRLYSGLPMAVGASERKDTIVGLRARLQAVIADNYSISAEYSLLRLSTDYQAMFLDSRGNVVGADDPDFTRHEFTVGLTVAY